MMRLLFLFYDSPDGWARGACRQLNAKVQRRQRRRGRTEHHPSGHPLRALPIVGATRRVAPTCRSLTPQQRNPRRGTACRAPTRRAPTCGTVAPHAAPVHVGATRCVAHCVRRPLRASPIACVAHCVRCPSWGRPAGSPRHAVPPPRNNVTPVGVRYAVPLHNMPYRGPHAAPVHVGATRCVAHCVRRPLRASPIACVAHRVGATRCVAHHRGDPPGRPYMPSPHAVPPPCRPPTP
jgi:hypothetical protein